MVTWMPSWGCRQLALLRAPSACSQESISLNLPRQYNHVSHRNKTLKRVRLFYGNFVLGFAVSTKLHNLYAYKAEHEITHMRYLAATGDPIDFKDNGFMLHQDDTHFVHTMHGVMKDIAYLCKRDRIAITDSNNTEGGENGIVPIQITLASMRRAIRRSSRTSGSSTHLVLPPNVCVLLDIGTRTGPILILWKAFDTSLHQLSPQHGAGADISTANMYLAEDREPVPKRGGWWVLHYVKLAYAITDTQIKWGDPRAGLAARLSSPTSTVLRVVLCASSGYMSLELGGSQLEPWHMITSFVQYTLLTPSYINILNVYAARSPMSSNNKVSTDLGVVKASKGENAVEVAVRTAETDNNAAYEDAIHVLSTKPPKEEKKEDAATKQEDYYRNFKTNVSLAWLLSNENLSQRALLIAVILTTNGSAKTDGANSTVNEYLIFILYSVALLAFVRFVGSTAYMIIRLFTGE
ncbi:hypothetical protein EDB83DRAFT_2516503 [Lactarius deliciosus]|nr:hypothetical protein EDB83DRAFT_2516503 [Lactarius deliciosus]